MPVQRFDFQFANLTLQSLPAVREELETLRVQLGDYKLAIDQALSEARLSIQAASRRAAATCQYSDPKWFTETQSLVSSLGRESQRVQALMGEVSRRIRQLNGRNHNFADVFVEMSRNLLAPADFERITAATQRVCSPALDLSGG